MKILAIRIKNLASLEGTTEIDFAAEPLCSAGIFAITGTTGAGKSTILDALCLALYGKTPRYLQAKESGIEIYDVQGSTLNQGDVRSILRDGTADGFAEVDFRGIDGQDYRATWSVRRARNKVAGSMQADSIVLKNISFNVDIPGKKQETLEEITRLVGLNFDQFTRSVLLAQGDFTAFMKASKDDKSSLLEKLTGTHVYSEISKKIYEKYKFEEQQLRDLNIRKDGVAILSEEELNALLEQQSVLEIQIKGLATEIENLTVELSWHEQLNQLQTNYTEANTTLANANEVKLSANPRKQKLSVAEQVQQTRSWADALAHAEKQRIERTTNLFTLKENILLLQEQQEKLGIQILASVNESATQTKTFNDASPLLEQAKKMDTLLAEKQEQLEKVKIENESATEKSGQQQSLLAAKQLQFTHLSAEIKTIVAWKLENTTRSTIAENRDIICSKLQDAEKLLKSLMISNTELGKLKEKIITSETTQIAMETNLGKQVPDWESLKKSYDIQAKEVLTIPIDTLNLNKEAMDQTVENTIKAQASWQPLYNVLNELKTLSQKQVTDESDYIIKAQKLQELSQQLVLESTQKETTKQLLQQAQLASAENVEMLRANLIADEPCPVCGSTSHPYALHNPQLENVLTKLKEAYEEKERIYLANYREHNALEQACQTLQQTIKNQSEAIINKQSDLETKKQVWTKFDVAQESHAIADVKRADWIEEKLQILKSEQQNLLRKIQDHATQKQKLEADKIQIDHLKESIDTLTNQLKDTETAITLSREQRNSKINEQQKATLELDEVEKTLHPYFNASDWMENWKADPLAFLQQIDKFAIKWKENTEQLAQYTLQKGAFEATLKELENHAKQLLADLTAKTAAFTLQNQTYLDLKQQRNAIFEGRSAEEVDIELRRAITEAQKKLDQLKETQQELNISLAKANTQQAELLATLSTLKAEAKKASQRIEVWLSDYNKKNNHALSITELHELLKLNNDWIETERIALQSIDDEVTKATSILAERKQLLDIHRQKSLSTRPLDELSTLITSAKSNEEVHKHKRGEIGFRLQQDKANKVKIGDLLKTTEKQAAITENWSKLNEIIGSADGKKFRQIAQEYTLDVLLGYANIHLQALTSRYKIERIPSSLGLQVVDQDMGDEVRTVYSLSGGESFLVSLALALGLASLSSSRMKVESLFIDEGFGSLDPTTLNIAMDALERLHNQGRKVGVISHVQEMTERIPVQIKVSKQQSGKSLVEVLGY